MTTCGNSPCYSVLTIQDTWCRYNAIMIIPYQLERLLWYGLLVCLDSFLVGFCLNLTFCLTIRDMLKAYSLRICM